MFTERTMTNPLLDAIFEIITTGEHLKIHELAAQLKAKKALPILDPDPHKELFKKNFLIMNALYQLQDELHTCGYTLHVSNLDIHIQPTQPIDLIPDIQPAATRDPLKAYYLDWNNYETTKEEVESLLSDFWQKYLHTPARLTDKDRANLQIKWQLPTQYTAAQLQRRWRQLAIANHPDKGGCTAVFQQLKQEYEQLKGTL
ncbi:MULTISPECIES: DNA-J related domain-containing protein [Pseudoalteromonas]|uniref:DNA-J related protein n=1 Tax=Pseudoalteromonas luteoviolacea (strain 2ta16) TaxID=1353533 RepID=V4H7Z8_PSEL2|nr:MULTISPECIES: DNA-J related domain-containing protein [Pseudoalteromonas]ESP93611.1 DNA-J related protein [Pseudoalteromonas luteoviolacea 2ta16]KZN34498.1 hypothetical protein N483_25210 [Pseudoalteromonas luteoviolacea NCIMB 1944]MCG7548685.1 molecular chaperone DnaJ [Pseudoalteromonas sp. Of7M-16]